MTHRTLIKNCIDKPSIGRHLPRMHSIRYQCIDKTNDIMATVAISKCKHSTFIGTFYTIVKLNCFIIYTQKTETQGSWYVKIFFLSYYFVLVLHTLWTRALYIQKWAKWQKNVYTLWNAYNRQRNNGIIIEKLSVVYNDNPSWLAEFIKYIKLFRWNMMLNINW